MCASFLPPLTIHSHASMSAATIQLLQRRFQEEDEARMSPTARAALFEKYKADASKAVSFAITKINEQLTNTATVWKIQPDGKTRVATLELCACGMAADLPTLATPAYVLQRTQETLRETYARNTALATTLKIAAVRPDRPWHWHAEVAIGPAPVATVVKKETSQ